MNANEIIDGRNDTEGDRVGSAPPKDPDGGVRIGSGKGEPTPKDQNGEVREGTGKKGFTPKDQNGEVREGTGKKGFTPKDPDEGVSEGAEKKGLTPRRKKVLIVVVIIVIALAVGLWGAIPPDYMSVRELVKRSDSYIGKEVEVRGEVGNWSGGPNFTLLDDSDPSISINVTHDGAMPEGFAQGKDVVVTGRLQNEADGLTILSTRIQTGCPSKY